MEDIRSILGRLPQRELEIRRRCARDARFRSICTDYEEATRALRHWQQAGTEAGQNKDRNIEDYSNFLAELEAEILAHLNRSASNGGHA